MREAQNLAMVTASRLGCFGAAKVVRQRSDRAKIDYVFMYAGVVRWTP